MLANSGVTRRDVLAGAAAAAVYGLAPRSGICAAEKVPPKSVAAIITAYEHGLHADVLCGKILEGWKQDGGPGPALKLASMYVEQFTDRDLARPMSKKHGVPIFDTIEGAVTVGGNSIPVDGVIVIGEHGDYPYNEKGQHLYPRKRFIAGVADAFVKYGKVVPVFHDKHLGPEWPDALWIYERMRQLNVPFMAGSSLAVTFRTPDIDVPLGSPITAAVGIGYSGLDIYGFHALEAYQSYVERRGGAETGVEWVQCLQGDAMWRALSDGTVSRELFDAAFAQVASAGTDPRSNPTEETALFLFRYRDGFQGAVCMLPGVASRSAVALRIDGQSAPLATRFEEYVEGRHPHFAYLLKGIERMIHTGRPSYPVERTLLNAGILDRALTSRFEKQQRLETPELAIAYRPVDYPHAPRPALDSDPRG
ncbi:MAG: hypothetical protein U0992_13155 [Planctomycetaceae bacterium]